MSAFSVRTLCAVSAALVLCNVGCGTATAMRPAPRSVATSLSPWQADSLVVRGILDTNGLRTVPVETVARAEHGRVVCLTFGRQTTPIHVLPSYVGALSRLTELVLTECGLRTLPRQIDYLENLSVLRLDRNRLVNLPEDVCDLPNLRELSLSRNLLVELPHGVGRLRRLQVLDVSYNRLTALPDSLTQLTALRALNLAHNRLTDLPAGFGDLDSLLTLKLDHNNLTVLPEQIGGLASLRILQAANNRLQRIPDAIGDFRVLNVLHLAFNDLESLPAGLSRTRELIVLDVTGNRLSFLPVNYAASGQFPRLTTLTVDNNRLCSLTPALSAWLERLSPSWRSRQICGPASGAAFRHVPVALGDSLEIDGQAVAFLAYKELERRVWLLVRCGPHVGIYQPGAPIGREDLGSKVSRFVSDGRSWRMELTVDRRFVATPAVPGRYEIVGTGASVFTLEVGDVVLERAFSDSAVLAFNRGVLRVVRPGQSTNLAWGDIRATLRCRWLFHDGRGRGPEFQPDSLLPVHAIGFDLELEDRGFRPRLSDRQARIAADPSAVVEIYDLSGRLLATAPYERADELTASMPSGNYLRRFSGGGEAIWDRFFVNR